MIYHWRIEKVSWLKKNRAKLIPEVKGDYSSRHDDLRYKSVKQMTWNEWFWFSPYQYQIQYYGGVGFPLVFLTFGCIYSFNNSNYIFSAICGVLSLLLFFEMIKRIKQYKQIKDTNMYDLHFREIILQEPKRNGEN